MTHPRTKVVLQSHQFSASNSPDTPRTKVVLQSRQFSSSSSPDTPRTKVVLQSRQFSASSSTDCSAYSSCTTKSPVLSFQLHRLLRTLKLYYKVASSHLAAPQILRVLKLYYKVASSQLPAPQILRVLKLYYKVASSQLPAPQIAPRTKVVLQSRQFSSSSSPDTPRTKVVIQSRQFSSSSSPDTPAYSSCTTKSPVLSFQLHRLLRVLKLYYKVASSQLPAPQIAPHTKVVLPSPQFSSSSSPDTLRTKGLLQSCQFSCSSSPATPRTTVVLALSPALDTHDLRRGLRRTKPSRTLACISRPRHARSPQRVAPDKAKSHSRLHFAPSTRTISAEGCAGTAPGLKRES